MRYMPALSVRLPRLRISGGWLLRLALTVYLLWLVYLKLTESAYDAYSILHFSGGIAWAWAALLLVPVNMGLETIKWYLPVRRFYPQLTLQGAALRVLAGAAAGFVTPNRWGEYAGRVLSLPTGHRTEAALVTLLSRLTQLAAALLAGGIAALTIRPAGTATLPLALDTLAVVALGGYVVVLLACLLPQHWLVPLHRLPHWRQLPLYQLPDAAARIPMRHRVLLLVLGHLRYGSFVLQFATVLWAYGAPVDAVQVLQFCGLLFVCKALVPSIALAELGVREALALAVATLMGLAAGPVFNATLLIFGLNLVLPALAGTVCLWHLSASTLPQVNAPAQAR